MKINKAAIQLLSGEKNLNPSFLSLKRLENCFLTTLLWEKNMFKELIFFNYLLLNTFNCTRSLKRNLDTNHFS